MITQVKKPRPASAYDVIRWNVPNLEISIPNIWRLNAWVEVLAAPIPTEELARLESTFQARIVWACRQCDNHVRYAQALLASLERGLSLIRDQVASASAMAA